MHFMELQNALYGISLYLPMFSLSKTQSDPKHPTQHHYRATGDICGIVTVTAILRPSWIRFFNFFSVVKMHRTFPGQRPEKVVTNTCRVTREIAC